MKEIGADPLLRGFATAFASGPLYGIYVKSVYSDSNEIPNCEIRQEKKGNDTLIQHITPVGTLHTLVRHSDTANTNFVIGRPVERKEDYKILSYVVEHLEITPEYEAIAHAIDQVGEEGLYVPLISPFLKTPFQSLVEHFVGTENLVYHLADFPEEVEALLEVMSEKAMQAVRISVESPAEAFITWEDSSTTNVSPQLFARYIAPEMRRWADTVHEAGKLLIHHACGHVRALLPYMVEEGVDSVESLAPPPTGNVEIWEAQDILEEDVGIIGGIEPVFFLQSSLQELRVYVENLLSRASRYRGYGLANSDSCPPGVSLEKFKLITDIVADSG